MEDIGSTLRDAREKLGLTLEEVERGTRIRVRYLEAMEKGDFDYLPSTVQARGFLRNYAEFLGLDRDAILLTFAETVQRRSAGPPASVRTRPIQRQEPVRPSLRRRWFSSDLAVTLLLVAFILAMLGWGVSRIVAALRVEDETLQEAAELVQPSATATIALSTPVFAEPGISSPPEVEAATAAPTQPLLPGLVDTVRIRVVAEQRVLLVVRVDGVEAFNGRMAPGDVQDFLGETSVEILTSSAGGIRVYYNDQDQGSLGVIDEALTRVWTLDGLTTPTPTISPTPTVTPTPTITPRVTATPTTTPRVLPGE